MTDIDINPGFGSKAGVLTIDRNLAELIREAEKSVQTKTKKFGTDTNLTCCENLIKDFLCTYAALSTELHEKELFSNERNNNYFNLVKTYSIYCASKTTLNALNDLDIEQLRLINPLTYSPSLTYSDIEKTSDYVLLEPLLKKIISVPSADNPTALKYNYFKFFDRLREICKNNVATNCGPETLRKLNDLKIFKTGLDFHELSPPKKGEFGNNNEKTTAESNVEQLPTELPTYEPNSRAKLEGIIGNTYAKETLHAAIIRLLKYDSTKKMNPFKEAGDFKNAFIVYGAPGVGKNYTLDAILNHIKSTSSEYREQFQIVDFSKGIRSMYKDRSAQILQRYSSIQNQGEKAYINIIDEADGIFTTDENGERSEESTKLLSEMKKTINNADKGNSVYIFMTNYAEKFEAALKQRFTLLEMQGPTTPDDFGKLLRQELNGRTELSDETLYEFGKRICQHKNTLRNTIPITGRDVKKIVTPFVTGDDKVLTHNEETVRKASYEQTKKLIPQLANELNSQALQESIETHIDSIKRAAEETTARYNK